MAAFTWIAYREDGTVCRAPATILDHQRGGVVCLQHVPADLVEDITLSPKMGTIEGRLDHHREVLSWRLDKAFDTSHCPTHGARRRRRGEVRQVERDEVCVHICTLCREVADLTSLDAGAEEGDR